MLSKFFQLIKSYQSDIVLCVVIILISVISFNLGKISSLNGTKTPVKITGGESVENPKSQLQTTNYSLPTNPQVVASKNSKGKLYHFLWCPGASQIAEKNKITFVNEAAAIAAGYTLAGNCQK